MNEDIETLVHAMMPEISLVLGALIVLGFDLAFGRKASDRDRLRTAAVLGMLALFVAVFHTLRIGVFGSVYGGAFVIDRMAFATRLGVLVLAELTLVIASGTARVRNPAEYVATMLFATAGLVLMASAQQLLVGFLSLELASLSLYILTGFDKTRVASAEAALKYFLFGGMSAAFLLFGFSLIYGLTGSIDVRVISHQLATQSMSPLLVVALAMILVAFGFKAAAAPFHLWAPDAYEGAPSSSAALIASASKLAGFIFFGRLFWSGLPSVGGSIAGPSFQAGWLPIVAVVSLASLLIGNFGALAQTNLRRLLAYSAIAHAGAIFLGVIAMGHGGPAPLYYYALTYGIATVGAFGVIAAIERVTKCDAITDLAGLYRRSPLLAVCLFVFILSLAGIPPLAGFFGKFGVFAAALQINGLGGIVGWLTILAILMSAVALYYYLVVLKQALVVAPHEDAAKIAVPIEVAVVLVLAAGLLVLLGVFPTVVLRMVS